MLATRFGVIDISESGWHPEASGQGPQVVDTFISMAHYGFAKGHGDQLVAWIEINIHAQHFVIKDSDYGVDAAEFVSAMLRLRKMDNFTFIHGPSSSIKVLCLREGGVTRILGLLSQDRRRYLPLTPLRS